LPAPVAESDQDDEAIITELLGMLKISTEGVKESDISPADFEKDDD